MRESMGSRLKRLRTDRGLTQSEVSEATGVDRPHLSRMERDQKGVSIDSLCALADFYNASVDYITRGTGAPFPGADKSCQPPYTPEEFAMIELWREMNEDQRRTMISLMTQLVRTNAA